MHRPAHNVPLREVLSNIVQQPFCLLRDWNWKAAAFSALLRAIIFLVANRHAAHHAALKASVTELIYATLAAGLAGTITQRLRYTTPDAKTAFIVWFALPSILSVAQYAVHRAMGTPHLRGSLIASFIFAAFASGFNWFSMRRGAFVTGAQQTFSRDLALVPRLIVQFILSPMRKV